jgi:hypothetical protein
MKSENNTFYKIIGKVDTSASPLRLNSIEYNPGHLITTINQKVEKMGKYNTHPSQNRINKEV